MSWYLEDRDVKEALWDWMFGLDEADRELLLEWGRMDKSIHRAEFGQKAGDRPALQRRYNQLIKEARERFRVVLPEAKSQFLPAEGVA